MVSFLVLLKPMEPYFLGGERNFDYGQANKQMKSTYFLKSEEVPQQTTLLGMLRRTVLEHKGVLRSNFIYREKDMGKIEKLIGEKSFDFLSEGKPQSFGEIQSISPLFLIDDDGNYYIKTPFNHRNEEEVYTPFDMEKDTLKTNFSDTLFPTNYDAKQDVADGYLCLQKNEIGLNPCQMKKSIFQSKVQVGIQKDSKERGFFRKEYMVLNEKYSFAFFVNVRDEDSLPRNTIIYMGQKKCAFAFTAIEKQNDLFLQIKMAIQSKHSIYYAISDVKVNESLYSFCDFACVKVRSVRNLKTKNVTDKKASPLQKMTTSKERYYLIAAGSVFYVKDEDRFLNAIENENCETIGLNKVMKLEGTLV